jgi:putative hydrolase of the HAD superfamily
VIRNIVFDMGMVLMDYHPLEACRAVAPDEASAQKLCASLFMDPEWIRLDDASLEPEELGRRAQARLDNEALRPLIPALLDGMPYNTLSPIPGMAEVVDWTLAADFRVYLLSNACRAVSEHPEIIPRLEKFHGVMFSYDEKVLKPNPVFYRRLTERFGLNPGECFFIDDNADNVEGARDAGWQAYRFDGDVPALRRELEALRAAGGGR